MTTVLGSPERVTSEPAQGVGVAVVGAGYWGPNLIRNFAQLGDARVVAVCDQQPQRLQTIARRYPSVALTTDFSDMLADPAVEAVAIATPVSSHATLARQALLAGKHVLIEKPMTASVADAEMLVDLACQRRLTLMVDHTFIYTGAVQRIKQLVATEELGDLYYYDSVRVSLGAFQQDVSVVWDLAAHDLSIIDYIVPAKAQRISALAAAHFPGGVADVAYLTLQFDNNLIAHFHVNWLSPVKVRQVLIGGNRRMVLYDDIEPTEKVKVYDRGVLWTNDPSDLRRTVNVAYRLGDMYAPRLDQTEALEVECAHFIDCVRSGSTPQSDGEAGLRVVRLLAAAEQSLRDDGRPQVLSR
ncbi:MAG TPA: Gfo/Idh/MocA family oxidoreductase [Dehalococcoidia bacterium]|nr:Gfo/Idh/MocA family oxidoreductase [Dehalococcoidia bacterium]